MPVKIEGLDAILETLRGIRERAGDLRPPLTAWADAVEALVTATATQERTPEGTRWARRKPTRIGVSATRGRPRRGTATGRPVGQLTGAMVRSIQAAMLGDSAVDLRVSAPYAIFFAGGSRKRHMRGRKIMPSRIRGPIGEAYAAFVDSLAGHVLTGLRGRRRG